MRVLYRGITTPGASVTVCRMGTLAKPPIFGAETGFLTPNPITAGQDGSYFFWVESGRYDLKNGATTGDLPGVSILDHVPSAVEADLDAKGRAALTANQVYLAKATTTTTEDKAQIKRLTRECSALIRLLLGGDLLDDTATDT